MARTKKTIEPEIKILAALAFTPELEQYIMPKRTGLSYRTILRTLKPMTDQKYIELVRTDPSSKGGKEKKIYALASKGLITALRDNHDSPEKIEAMLKQHLDMLLIAKKLASFESIQIKEHVLGLLSVILDQKTCYQGIEISLPFQYSEQPNIDYDVVLLLLMYGPVLFPENYDKFIELCKTDKELDSLIQRITKKESKRISETMSWQAEWEDYM
jgi:DNA-binding PadR family transcriptional regulator